MKKIVAIFSFILAFTLNANAQDQKLSGAELAKKEAHDFKEYVGLTPTQEVDLIRLFEHKYRVLQDVSIPDARKTEMKNSVMAKINASITTEQQEKLAKNPELLERLVN